MAARGKGFVSLNTDNSCHYQKRPVTQVLGMAQQLS